MSKPSYKIAHNVRKAARGSSSMEIEPVNPGTKVLDKTKPEPHTEELVPNYPPGKKPLGIVPNPISGGHVEPGTVKPGEYERPDHSDLVKT